MGFGQFLFYDWRFLDDGTTPHPDFELNQAEVTGASILVARHNFGSGSSREHAVWALEDYGFRVVIAPSFADIFFNNCFKNGILPIVLEDKNIDSLFAVAGAEQALELTVDLKAQTLALPDGELIPFEVDPFRKYCLLEGLDDIGLTLRHAEEIEAFEARRRERAPWLFGG